MFLLTVAGAKTLLTALDDVGLPKKQVKIVKAKELGPDIVSQVPRPETSLPKRAAASRHATL